MENDLHLKITAEAVKRLKVSAKALPPSANQADLVAVHIDLLDTLPTFYEGTVYKMNHDSPGAQPRHFMRNAGESNATAHGKALDWIRNQATRAALDFRHENEILSRGRQLICEQVVVKSGLENAAYLAGTVGTFAAKDQKATPFNFLTRKFDIPESFCSTA